MTENEPFKNMIENAYLQQRQMIETNASILKKLLWHVWKKRKSW